MTDPMKKSGKKIRLLIVAFCIACLAAGATLWMLPGKTSHGPESTGQGPTSAGTTSPTAKATAPSETGEPEKESASAGKKAVSDHPSVYIETGHGREDNGGWDGGCSWSDGTTTYEEATVMIPIARAMTDYLEKSGVTVYTDARDDNNVNLEETLAFLDQHPEIDAFVNLHCDYSEAEPGTMPLYRTEEQLVLAKALNRGVHSVLDIADRGETYRDDLDTLTRKEVHCPAVLFETGSIKADNEILTTKTEVYGKGLAKGMCQYLGVPFSDR